MLRNPYVVSWDLNTGWSYGLTDGDGKWFSLHMRTVHTLSRWIYILPDIVSELWMHSGDCEGWSGSSTWNSSWSATLMSWKLWYNKIHFNLYHSLDIFSRRQMNDIFLTFPRKQDLTFHANCLLRRQFAWNAISCFLGKIRKIFQNVVLKNLPRVLSVKKGWQ